MKAVRHRAILRIVREIEVKTQEQLVDELRSEGFDVTQATVSRDVRELGLLKVAMEPGEYRYAVPPDATPLDTLGRAQRAFREYVQKVDCSGNLVVLKTLPGSASVVAAALDALESTSIVGTVAGDDAVLVVVRDERPDAASKTTKNVYARFVRWKDDGATRSI